MVSNSKFTLFSTQQNNKGDLYGKSINYILNKVFTNVDIGMQEYFTAE